MNTHELQKGFVVVIIISCLIFFQLTKILPKMLIIYPIVLKD